MFNNLTDTGLEKAEDRLGGGYSPRETDIYTFKIKAAYAGKSQGGAMNVSIIAADSQGEYRETIYITNRKGENFFVKDGKKVPLPGFTIINDLCLITTGSPLSEQETEDKVINLYDYDAKKEVPTTVPMIMALVGTEVSLAIHKNLEDKNTKNSDGEYVPTGETRETNTIGKVFHTETKMTVVEALEGAEEAKFWDAWVEKNQGKVFDRTNKDAAKNGGKPVAGRPAPSTSAKEGGRPSLFGKK